MTTAKYVECLDHGFVGMIDVMGDDNAIAEAARVSYATGTKQVRNDEGLIRYLMRHEHTSPFEMCEVKWHVKCPIFVARQWVRHRTASINEQSGRYSELVDEFHTPRLSEMKPQSASNKQGRDGAITDADTGTIAWIMQDIYEQSYQAYEYLLGKSKVGHTGYMTAVAEARERTLNGLSQELSNEQRGALTTEKIEELLDKVNPPLLSDGFPGLARETAREVLPVSIYTQFYWKTNLLNLFRFLKLRLDPHAQEEIREYAFAMYDMVEEKFPIAMQAFDDYWNQSVKLSRMEWAALMASRADGDWADSAIRALKDQPKVSQREIDDFTKRFK